MEYVRRKSVIIYMKYFTTSWSLETLITHFFVLTIYAIFENYLIVIPKHVPEYFQVIEHVPRFLAPIVHDIDNEMIDHFECLKDYTQHYMNKID